MSARKFLVPLDLTKNELQNAVVQNLGSAPSSPGEGQLYWDTSSHRLYSYNANASAWQLKATDSDLLQGNNAAYHLSRANHTGTQLAATISDLATAVQAYRLDQFVAPTADISLNGRKITNLAAPTATTDAVTKAYVDSTIQGLTPKPTAMAATTAALPSCTYANGTSGVGATLTGSANGALTVDSYAVAAGDVLVVRNQASGFQNGLYSVTQPGTGSTPFILTRHVDMDTSLEFGGSFVPVENLGTVNANTLWLCNNNAPTVGTTAISFTQLNASTSYTQGNGISISGNTVTAVAAASGGVSVVAGGIQLDTAVAVRKFAQAFGDGSTTSVVITHGLNTQDVAVAVYSATTPFAEVECDVLHTSVNTVTLIFAVAPTSNQYRVVVHG